MKNLLIFSTLLFLLTQCNPGNRSSNESENSDSTVRSDTVTLSDALEKFRMQLANLPLTEPSSLAGLELFKNDFNKEKTADNDAAFMIYLKFQSSLIDTLNAQLPEHPHYDEISSLIWADTTLYKPEGKAYEKELAKYGLRLTSTEGMMYIARDVAPIKRYFYQHLSSSTQRFFPQFEAETNQPFAEDGGLAITVNELADRVGFWDAFLSDYPRHIFSKFAKDNKEAYLYFLLIGMNNTPAFDYESHKIDDEFLTGFKYFIQKYPDTGSAKVVDEYLKLLEANGYKKNEAVEAFIKKYNPY